LDTAVVAQDLEGPVGPSEDGFRRKVVEVDVLDSLRGVVLFPRPAIEQKSLLVAGFAVAGWKL